MFQFVIKDDLCLRYLYTILWNKSLPCCHNRVIASVKSPHLFACFSAASDDGHNNAYNHNFRKTVCKGRLKLSLSFIVSLALLPIAKQPVRWKANKSIVSSLSYFWFRKSIKPDVQLLWSAFQFCEVIFKSSICDYRVPLLEKGFPSSPLQ